MRDGNLLEKGVGVKVLWQSHKIIDTVPNFPEGKRERRRREKGGS
jgi:hypothetical protein